MSKSEIKVIEKSNGVVVFPYQNENHENNKEIAFKKRFNEYNEKGKAINILDADIRDHIKEKNNIINIGGQIYTYSNGVYIHDDGGRFTMQAIENCIERNLITSFRKKAILDLFFQESEINRTFETLNQYDDSVINFKNTMFDVKNWKAVEHSPNFYAMNQIDIAIDKNIPLEEKEDKHPVFTKFMSQSIPKLDDLEMLLQYLGLCLTKDATFQLFMIITGESNTGKSVVCNLISRIVGSKNKSALSLEDVAFSKFRVAGLNHKLINVCSDISGGAIKDPSTIKQVTGEDEITVEHKGQTPFTMRSYAKFIFSCNELPKFTGEKSKAMYNRLRILEMNIVAKEKDRNLLSKLEKEKEYIVYTLLRALHRAYKNNEITESEKSKKLTGRLEEQSDSIVCFINQCMEVAPKNKIGTTDCYRAYRTFCEDEGRTPHNKTNFFSLLVNKGYEKTKTSNWYFEGLDFNWQEMDEELREKMERIFK